MLFAKEQNFFTEDEMQLLSNLAGPDTMTAINSESRVIGISYDIGIGSRKASMPMKCIDQMPVPWRSRRR